MVNPGSFQGARKEFLLGEKAAYKAGVTKGYAQDALANIQRRFFKRFPIDLPLSVDPTPEEIAAIDDDTPEVEYPPPDEEKMTSEEFSVAMKEFEDRQRLIQFRKDQIKRWLAYQYMKDQELDPRETGAQAPYNVLLSQLTGGTSGKPRQKTAMNIWRRTHTEEIEAALKLRASQLAIDQKRIAAMRESVAKELFAKLGSDEKEEWKLRAKEEHDTDLASWKKAMTDEPSNEPADRQRCIQGLTKFIQPILDGICAATGWKATFIAGGPEPAHGGRLNVLSVHSGTTSGNVKMTFGRAERAAYKKHILDAYGRFLKKCYTVEECRSRALPDEEGFEGLNGLELDDGAEVHTVLLPGVSSSNSQAVESANADFTMANPEGGDLPTNAQVSDGFQTLPLHQNSTNSRAPSPAFVSPNPSQLPSPTTGAPINLSSHPTESGMTISSNPYGGLPSKTTPPAHSIEKPTSTPHSIPQPEENITAASSHFAPAPLPESSQNPSVNLVRKRERTASATTSEEDAALEQPSKQLRTSTVDTPEVAAASNPPGWFTDVSVMFEEPSLDACWGELVKLWSAFEQKESYTEVGKLSAKHRPAAVGQWIGRARLATWRPNISDLPRFERQFQQWWLTLQPPWRVSDGRLLRDVVDGDWDCLRRPGKNGLVSVLAALFYWGLVAKGKPGRKKAWVAAVKDCHIAFCHLLA